MVDQGKIGLEEYTLVNVYAPNNKQGDFHNVVIKEMEKVKKGYVIMAGDFNMVMDKIKDKTFYDRNDVLQRNTILSKKVKIIEGYLEGNER